MTDNGCPCKGMKGGLVHALALFLIIFVAILAANFATHLCPWFSGQITHPPAAAAQIK
jgi:hypothetical protein